MKKISICLLSGLLLLSSCLDEDPKYMTDSQVAFSSEQSAQTVLNGLYGLMAVQGSFAQLLPEINTEASGLCWTSYDMSVNRSQYVNGVIPVENEFNNLVWGAVYQAINNCNIFIDELSSPECADWDSKANMIAQAKFLRGVCYYQLYTLYGGVPLRIEPTTSENTNIPRASRQEVIDQIIKDWSEAARDLDDKSKLTSGAPTAPCKASAWAYLAKLYWLMGCNSWAVNENGDPWGEQLRKEWPEMNTDPKAYFRQAKVYGDSVFQAGVFKLEPNFRTLFGGNRLPISDEFVFVIDATMNTTENVGYNSLHWTFSPQNCSPGETWGRAQPNKAFYNWAMGTYQDDPRLDATFMTSWYKYVNGTESTEFQVSYPNVYQRTVKYHMEYGPLPPPNQDINDWHEVADTVYAIVATIDYKITDGKKGNIMFDDVTNPDCDTLKMEKRLGDLYAAGTISADLRDSLYRVDSILYDAFGRTKGSNDWNINDWPYFGKYMTTSCSGRYADNNLYVYRYADFLLLMADVENELGNTGVAEGYVNEVLTRARQSTDSEGNANHTYPLNISDKSQNELREYIFMERLFELAAEYDGFIDTRRRGVNWRRKILEMNNNDKITSACFHYGESHGYQSPWREYWYPTDIENASDAQWNEFLIKNQLVPLPRMEFSSNNALNSITDQNYGY